MEKPKFNLDEVRQVIRHSGSNDVAMSSALKPVVSNLEKTYTEAEAFILDEICELDLINFNSRILIGRGPGSFVYDIYGKRILNIPWYIKFTIKENSVEKYLYGISFHPTTKVLQTRSETLEIYIN